MTAVRPVATFRRRRGLAVLAFAAVLVIAGSLASPTPVAAVPEPVTGGALEWGVKASFRAYITGPAANGSITPADGATDNGNGTYRFPVSGGSHDQAGANINVAFAGSLRFLGHGGALDITVSDLRIEVSGTAGVVRADVVTKNRGTGTYDTHADIELVSFDLNGVTPSATAGGWRWSGVPASLTQAGSNAFGGFYPAQTPMDPITFELLSVDQQPTTTTSDAPTTTTSTVASSTPPASTAVSATPRFAG